MHNIIQPINQITVLLQNNITIIKTGVSFITLCYSYLRIINLKMTLVHYKSIIILKRNFVNLYQYYHTNTIYLAEILHRPSYSKEYSIEHSLFLSYMTTFFSYVA